MRIQRRLLDDVDARAYDALTAASFTSSRGFLELWRARGGRPVVWTAERGGALAAAIPGVEFGPAWLRRFASGPDGCSVGAWVAAVHEAERPRVVAALLGAISAWSYARVHLFDERNSLSVMPGFARVRCSTPRVPIRDDEHWPADPGLRAQIRRAEREGLRMERYEHARHHRGFMALAHKTCRRHARALRYPAAFYAALARLAERDPRVVWKWCEHAGQAVASHIYFVECGRLQAWQSNFDKAFAFLKPNPWIRREVCREVFARGVRWLDLGGTPAGAAGLARYKARWGDSRHGCDVLTRAAGLGVAAEWLRSSIAPGTAPVAGAVPVTAAGRLRAGLQVFRRRES